MPVISYSFKKYQLFAHKPYTHLEENILAHKYICVSAVCDQPQGKRRPCNLNKKYIQDFPVLKLCAVKIAVTPVIITQDSQFLVRL